MKKRIIAIILMAMIILSLGGCSSDYPCVKIYHSAVTDSNSRINIGNEYKLKDYDKTYTDDGCTVTIYFENTTKEECN